MMYRKTDMYILEDRFEQCQQYTIDASKRSLQSQHHFSPVSNVLHQRSKKDIPSPLTVLLDERMFWWYRFDIIRTCKEPLTIKDIHDTLHEKLHAIQAHDARASSYVRHIIDHMTVDGEEVTYVLGKKGTISFSLHIFMLQPAGISVMKLLGLNENNLNKEIKIIPKHMFVLRHVHANVKKQNAVLLHIGDDMTQLISMEKGRYKDVHYLNVGINLLKSCYEEHGVEKHFYTSRDEVIENTFLTKVIDEAMSFFTDVLVQWTKEHVTPDQDIIVCGKITENPSFLPIFQDSYTSFGQGYVLPLASITVPGRERPFSGDDLVVGSVLRFA